MIVTRTIRPRIRFSMGRNPKRASAAEGLDTNGIGEKTDGNYNRSE